MPGTKYKSEKYLNALQHFAQINPRARSAGKHHNTNLNLKFQSLWQNNIEVMNIANVLFLYAIQYNITTLIQCNRFIY